MKTKYIHLYFIILISIGLIFQGLVLGQPSVLRSIEYQQITDFTAYNGIHAVKISADGSRIVFATSGGEVKVYVIDSDGTDRTVVYDYQTTGSGVFIDISGDGNKVIWSQRGDDYDRVRLQLLEILKK